MLPHPSFTKLTSEVFCLQRYSRSWALLAVYKISIGLLELVRQCYPFSRSEIDINAVNGQSSAGRFPFVVISLFNTHAFVGIFGLLND
jgi:hypothetical protein